MPPKVLTDAQLRDELDLVRGEVAGLQQLLRGVRSEVRELRQLVHQGLDQSEIGSSCPFTLVLEILDSEAPHISAERPKPSTAAAVRSHSPPLESEREAAAKAVGCFLRRALEGQRRGESGRDRIPQSSRYWLVIRGIDNQVFSPIRVFSKWASCSKAAGEAWCGLRRVNVCRPSGRRRHQAGCGSGGFTWEGLEG